MKSCKLCYSTDIHIVRTIQSPHIDHAYKLYECESCESRFFDLNEVPVDLSEIYDRMSPVRNTETDFQETEYWKRRREVLLSHTRGTPSSVLDVGCETGTFLMHLSGVQVREGVELSKYSCEIAAKRGLKVYNDFLENIQFERRFEVVTAFAIMEHLVEPHQFLKKLDSLVEPDGVLFILIPTHQCFKEKVMTMLGRRWKMYSPPEHLNLYSRRFLDSYLGTKGYKLEERYYDSGGNFNPLHRIPLLGWIAGALIEVADRYLLRRIPVFDHMYSIYRKEKE